MFVTPSSLTFKSDALGYELFPKLGKLDISSFVNSDENCSLRISAFSPEL